MRPQPKLTRRNKRVGNARKHVGMVYHYHSGPNRAENVAEYRTRRLPVIMLV